MGSEPLAKLPSVGVLLADARLNLPPKTSGINPIRLVLGVGLLPDFPAKPSVGVPRLWLLMAIRLRAQMIGKRNYPQTADEPRLFWKAGFCFM